MSWLLCKHPEHIPNNSTLVVCTHALLILLYCIVRPILQVRFLPTGQDVLRCELVNSTWRSSAMCALLPPISLTTEALNKTSPPCLSRNGSRLASLRAAFIIEPVETNTRHRNDIRASNRAAMEAVAAAATNLGSLVVNNVGYNFQDDVWSRLTSLTRLELHTSSGGSLPASLAALTGLQHLRINNFRGLRLSHLDEATSTEVHWLQQLTRLTTLSATYIHIFGEGVYMGGTFSSPLPASLQELELDHIPHFDDLKVDMAALTDLRSFTISGKMKQLPAELGSLQQLSRLCFSKCDSLEQLPGNLGQSPAVKSVSVICNTRDR
jgi:Leucine-rich repeat (LRR) protein